MDGYTNLQRQIESIGLEITPKKYTEKVFQVICNELEFKYGSILLFDENRKGQVYLSYQLPDYHPIFFDNVRFEKFSSINGADDNLENCVVVSDYQNEEFFQPWKVIISSLGLNQIVFVPLRERKNTFGLMVLYTDKKESVADIELKIINQLTIFISYTIFIKSKIENLESNNKQLEEHLEISRRKEYTLKNSEKQYKELIENMGEGLALVDKDENFLFANNMMEKIFGVEQYELMGRNLNEFMSPVEYKKILKQTELRKKGKKSKYQIQIVTPANEKRICSVTSTPYFGEKGEYIGSFGIFRDVTASKWTESIQKVLYKISEAANTCETLDDLFSSIHINLGELMNTNNFYIALYDDESKMIAFPYYVDEFEKPPPPRLPRNGLTEYVLKTAKPLLATQEIKEELMKEDKVQPRGKMSIDWLGVPLKIKNEPIGVLAIQSYKEEIRFGENEKNILVFVSEQIAMAIDKKRSDETLRLKQLQLKEAQKIAKIGSWEKNLITDNTFYSDNFFEIMDINEEQTRKGFRFEDHLEHIHIEDREKFQLTFNSDQTKKTSRFNFGYKIISANGKMKFINSVGLLRINENGQPFKLTVTIQDVTEQRSTEELMKEMEITKKSAELKQQFLANMSHEIRTPLNAIIGFAKLLDENIDGEKEKGYVNTILSSSNTLLVLINDILDLSKIEAGKMEIKYSPIIIKDLVSDIKKIFSLKIDEKGLDYSIDIDANFPKRVYLDETRMRQILLNLIGNAIKFTDNGFVKVSVAHNLSAKDENLTDLTIRVEDSGIGIPDDQKNKIFQSFTQISGQSYRKYGGTGLGLSITKKLVEIMGGMITLESELQKGTIFKVEIPRVLIAVDEDKERISAEYLGDRLPFMDIKILIVDYDDIAESLLLELIEMPNIQVVKSDNRIKSIEKALLENPDMILVNLIGNDMENSILLRQLYQHELIQSLPVIAIVDDNLNLDLSKMDKLHLDGIIRQSFSASEIRQLIYKYLTFKKRINKYERDIQEIDLSEYLSNIDETKLPKLIETLNKRYRPEFEVIVKSPRIKQIKEMSMKLKRFGKKHKLEILIHYGERLHEEADNFNISHMRKLSEYFPQIIKMLEEQMK